MRKTLILFMVASGALIAVMLIRAATVFEDQQIAPAAGLGAVDIDHLAALQRFSDALKVPTVSHEDRRDFDPTVFRAFHDFLRNAYPRVHRHARRTVVNDFSLVYQLPGSDAALEPVLFLAHMDVVPVEGASLDQWTHPPFGGTIDDGQVWGRGSLGDKLGVVSLMEALEMLLGRNVRAERSIYLAFGHDGELGGQEGAKKIAEYFEEQGIRFDFVLDGGGAVTEDLFTAPRPVAVIGVAEKGYVSLRLSVRARAGDSSQAPGRTAVGILGRAIVRVEENPFPARLGPLLQTFEAIGAHTPYETRLVMGNLWLLGPVVERLLLAGKDSASSIRTTTAAKMLSGGPEGNISPAVATAVINVRILPGESVESVRRRVIELIDDERVEVTVRSAIDPSPFSPTDSRGYELIASTIRGLDPDLLVAPYLVRGGTGARYFYGRSSNVYRFTMTRFDAATIRPARGIDERISIQDYLLAVRFYYHLLKRSMSL